MYSASLGAMVVRRDLLSKIENTFVGGGMASAVLTESYELITDDLASRFEPGLQAYGEIIALNAAIKWLKNQDVTNRIKILSEKLYNGLGSIPGLHIINNGPSSVISVYHDKVDAHRIAIFLSAAGIMVRSGYFCCHYYLIEKSKMPPLVRFSIGLHTTEADIDATIETMKKITRS
jgi:cysteine desulfurase/selenocysteine lyase